MSQDTTPDAYHATPAEAYHEGEPLAEDFRINDSQPPPSADFTAEAAPRRRANRGSFRKGHDPRRHTFTAEECNAGFWAGLASYVEQGGEARNFLRRKMAARGQVYTAMPKSDRCRLPKAA